MSPMHKTKTGRWQPDTPKKPAKSTPDGDDTELAALQAYVRSAMERGVFMPLWYPVMHFEAAVGRLALREDERS